MITSQDDWNQLLELLKKRSELQQKNQEFSVNDPDYLTLLEFTTRIQTRLIYTSRKVFIELFRNFVANPTNEKANHFCLEFQVLYENLSKILDELIDELVVTKDKERLSEIKTLLRPVDTNMIAFADIVEIVCGDCDYFNPMLSQEDTLFIDLARLEKSVKIALNNIENLGV
jgi:hypothetical protein